MADMVGLETHTERENVGRDGMFDFDPCVVEGTLTGQEPRGLSPPTG